MDPCASDATNKEITTTTARENRLDDDLRPRCFVSPWEPRYTVLLFCTDNITSVCIASIIRTNAVAASTQNKKDSTCKLFDHKNLLFPP